MRQESSHSISLFFYLCRKCTNRITPAGPFASFYHWWIYYTTNGAKLSNRNLVPSSKACHVPSAAFLSSTPLSYTTQRMLLSRLCWRHCSLGVETVNILSTFINLNLSIECLYTVLVSIVYYISCLWNIAVYSYRTFVVMTRGVLLWCTCTISFTLLKTITPRTIELLRE